MPFPYSQDAWTLDFASCSQALSKDGEVTHDRILKILQKRYSAPLDALPRADRIFRAFSYLVVHSDKLDDAKLVVLGKEKKKNLVHGSLVAALWCYFCYFDVKPDFDPPVEAMISLANEAKPK